MPEELKDVKLGDFDTSLYDAQNTHLAKASKKAAIAYVKKFEKFKETATGLYLYSDVKGSGKTRLAIGIGNALISEYDERVKYSSTTRLINEMKETFNTGGSSEYLNAVSTVPVLILDDIGAESVTNWVSDLFYDIINQRMLKKLITIYTSNCRIEDLKHDERTRSRIEGTVMQVQCPEQDIRVKLKREQNKGLEALLYD